MGDRCMVCGAAQSDWKRDDGFLCTEHWSLLPADDRKAFNKAAKRFRQMRGAFFDKDHPARDAASSKVILLWREYRDKINAILAEKAA